MNRMVVFGVAMFLAIVGIALLGGQNSATAGHGCPGCNGELLGGCHGDLGDLLDGCHGALLGGCNGGGLLGGCNGGGLLGGCHGIADCLLGCDSDDDEADEAEEDSAEDDVPDEPADAAVNGWDRAPVAFQKVSFRR